jgi:hypothetical protein
MGRMNRFQSLKREEAVAESLFRKTAGFNHPGATDKRYG